MKTYNSKILAVIVLYNPEYDEVVNNINSFIEYVDRLIIWSNSKITNAQREMLEKQCKKEGKLFFEGDGLNQGLSSAYNFALKQAIDGDYDFLLTMDQDSRWDNFEDYINKIKSEKETGIAIWGPQTVNLESNVKTHYEKNPSYVISSGCVYRVDSMKKIGQFQDYFIDAIDEEICFRAREKGFKVELVKDSFLLQHFGYPRKVKFFYKETTTPNYSATRYYYIIRNHLWLLREGVTSKCENREIIRNYIVNPFLKVILFEKNKKEKLKRMCIGLMDGLIRRKEEIA